MTTMDAETHSALDSFFSAAPDQNVMVQPMSASQILTQPVEMPVQGFLGTVGRFLTENSNEGWNGPATVNMPQMAVLDPTTLFGGPEIELNLPEEAAPAAPAVRKPSGPGLGG